MPYILADHVIFRRVGEEALLVPSRGQLDGCLFVLNDVGAFIWEQLALSRELSSIVSSLTETFEVDEAQATADLQEFLDGLVGAGCVQAMEPGPR